MGGGAAILLHCRHRAVSSAEGSWCDVSTKWLPNLDRLTVRLAVGIALLVVVPLAGGLYLLSRYQYAHSVDARRAAAELENRILETALRHQMLTRDNRLMTQILEGVAQQPEVRRAMVLNKNGVVRLSSQSADVGVHISRESPTCLVCHSKTPGARAHWVLLRDDGIDVLRTVQPIENRPECHQCHNAAAKLNGILILDVSLASIQAQVRSELGRMATATAILTCILLVGVGLHVRHLVLTRLNRLGRAARSIAAGSFGERVDSAGDDVIASLAKDFNNMADATSSLIEDVKGREQQLAGVLNSLDDGLVVLDRDFRVVAANRSIASRLCSYPETLRGRNCRDAVGHALPCHEDRECPTARCLSSGRLERATYGFASSADGKGRVHEVYASPVFDDNGSVAQVVEVWRDITERVREEQHLAEIERLSSLGVLASGLSHEVNTPLASTLTCSEAILDQLEAADAASLSPDTLEAIRDSAGIIRDQVLRCRTITDHFLRFARGIPPAIEPIDLQEVVRNIMTLARPTAREAGVDLVLAGNGPVPVVTANTEVVQHVVLNLLVNAIESFTAPGGSVVVRFLVDDHLRLQIRDDGCGIPPEARKHLFEPFRTQKPRGTGLGLFLSRTFMRRFNGDVRLIDSAPGRGSCIEVVFPRPDHEAH
jgi:PAS domain S-box-containing protein